MVGGTVNYALGEVTEFVQAVETLGLRQTPFFKGGDAETKGVNSNYLESVLSQVFTFN